LGSSKNISRRKSQKVGCAAVHAHLYDVTKTCYGAGVTPIEGLLLLAAAPASGLAADAEAQWVSFTLTAANQIRFAAQIDGRPAAAILDTGVTTTTVSRRFANAAKLKQRVGPGALTISGPVASAWTQPHTLTFGAVTQTGSRFAVADLTAAATGGALVDLLVGTDVTAPYALDIDYEAHRFRLLRSGRLPFHGSIAPLRLGATWPFYGTSVTIRGVSIARIAIDTGDGTGLSLSRRAADVLPTRPALTTTTLDYALGGATIADLAILPEFQSGSLTIRNVELRIEPPRGFAEATGMAGRIGSGLLQHYRVLLDPTAGRMVLAAGRDAGRPPLRSTSGLLLATRPNRLDVLHVMRGSPAERAGFTTGDTICAVDDVAITRSYEASGLARWPIGAPGRTVRLTDCAGVARPITLRYFY